MTAPILNQDEIRDLLRAPGSTGPVRGLWEGESTPFSFLAGGVKIEDQLKLVDPIHAAAATDVAKAWSDLCGVPVTLEFVSHTPVVVADVLASLSVENMLPVLWAHPAANLEGLIVCERATFYRLYTALLAGLREFQSPGPLAGLAKQSLLKLMASFATALQTAWAAAGAWQFEVREIIETQERLASLEWSAEYFQAQFKIVMGEEEKNISLLVPRDFLAALGGKNVTEDKVEAEVVVEGAAAVAVKIDRRWTEAVWWAVSDIAVPMEVAFGTARATMRDVLQLAPGMHFPLQVASSGLVLMAQKRPIFLASSGSMQEQRAVQIASRV